MYVQADGEKVRELRGAASLTAAEVAEQAGITRDTLRRVERNRGPVRVKTAKAIGRALDVDPRSFATAILSERRRRQRA